MKKSMLISVLLFSLLSSFWSCKKDHDNNAKEVKVKKNSDFQYNFGKIGMEDDFKINVSPGHFLINTLGRDNAGNIVYNYKPSLDFIGTDHVVLTHYLSAGGASYYDSVKFNFLLKVTE